MILKVKLTPKIVANITISPLKVEAPNHNTLMAIISAFKEENPFNEIFYNCAKINRKRINENTVEPSKWTAQIYVFEKDLLEGLYLRQNPRSFEVSFKPLKKIVYKPKTQRKPKVVGKKILSVEEEIEVENEGGVIWSSPYIESNSALVTESAMS